LFRKSQSTIPAATRPAAAVITVNAHPESASEYLDIGICEG
jgi:hypothetical protein